MTLTDFHDDPYLSLLRPLVEAYLALFRMGARHIESMGLTPSQFDVIVELGNTSGMTCADLSNATLVTKGTLTGVIDRLEAKGLVARGTQAGDRRAIKIRLTRKGQAVFRKVFPAHADFLRPYIQSAFSPAEVRRLKVLLTRLRDRIETPGRPHGKTGTQPKKQVA